MLKKYQTMTKEEIVALAKRESGATTKKQAEAYLQGQVPKEKDFQREIKKAIKDKYPKAYIKKIAQGHYSEDGIPDILCIIEGHYFGFEVKRPYFGKATPLQEKNIEWIRAAGGTAEVISYPEEALAIIEEYTRQK